MIAPELRLKVQRDLLSDLVAHGALYVMIGGNDWGSRFAQAVAAVDRRILRRGESDLP